MLTDYICPECGLAHGDGECRRELFPVPKPRRARKRKPKGLQRSPMQKNGPRTRKSGGALFPKQVDPAYRAFIRGEPCILVGRMRTVSIGVGMFHCCYGKVQACHVKSRGASGPDLGNLYPGCTAAHDEQGRKGIHAFEQRWGLNLAKIAAGLALRYTEHGR